jgi:hypothetical protein
LRRARRDTTHTQGGSFAIHSSTSIRRICACALLSCAVGEVEIPVAANLLFDGRNALAVELHPPRDQASSSAFDLALVAVH